MKEKEETEDRKTNVDFPNQQTKYQQVVEEMKQLIPVLQEEMAKCPSNNLIFTLIETIDFYSLKRKFAFKSKSKILPSNSHLINTFKEKYISYLSTFDSFITIPIKNANSFQIASSNKGNKLKSPKVFDINGDEGLLTGHENEIILFLYDHIGELNLFLQKNININLVCCCLGINMNFFETKKWIKNKGLLNNKNFYFYFANKSENDTNLKFYNLPRIVQIGGDNTIIEDKKIKNLHNFDLFKDFLNKNVQSEDKKEESNFIYMENDNKRKIIKDINIYLKTAGLNDIHFYVTNKISIDKNGIKKVKCYPAFFGETNKAGKYMIDDLVESLNKQELFKDVQNKVIYEYE